MKKIILATLLLSALLVGCGTPKRYGNITDWSRYDTTDFHVTFAYGENGCYSDGSLESNWMYDSWVKEYK